MIWMKPLSIVIVLSLVLLFIADNILHSLSRNDVTEQLEINFRHTAYDDYESAPSAYYASISNSSLSKNNQRFRTGKYGEVLHGEYDPRTYDKNCKYVFIGGSSTEARWVDEPKRWVALIDKKLRSTNDDIATFNFGVGGQNLAQSLNRYNTFISELKPKYVFVMHEANDISKFLKGGYSVKEGSLHNMYDRWPVHQSTLARLRSVVDNILPFSARLWRKYRNKNRIPSRSQSLKGFNGLDAYEAASEYMGRLLSLKELISAHGGTLVLIEYPQVYEEVLLGSFSDYNKNVRENIKLGLDNNGIAELDFMEYVKVFRQQLHHMIKDNQINAIETNNTFSVPDFYDAIHFNRIGSERFAQFIYGKLGKFNCG